MYTKEFLERALFYADSTKDSQAPASTSSKKKKKKNKNAASSGNTASSSPVQNSIQSDMFSIDSQPTVEPARILHNPGTNTVTIRNPSFGPMKVPPTQQAAIIKVSENGMVTIRSPALQQAINAGLTSPSPKPDYIVKSDLTSRAIAATTADCNSLKHANGIAPPNLAELHSRLTAPNCAPSELSIQISKVTNGQPMPAENGIKDPGVTLTKVRSETAGAENARQVSIKNVGLKEAATAITTASITAVNGNGNNGGKNKKKKKRGNGTRQCGDDWNLVGEKQQ